MFECSRILNEVPWISFLVALIVFSGSTLSSTSPTASNWPVTNANIGEYSFAEKDHDSVPNYALNLFLVFCALIAAAVEFGISVPADRIISALIVLFTILEAGFFAGIVTFWGKTYVAEPRPDFRSRCLGIGAATFDSNGLIQCTASSAAVDNARSSFVSGHASISFAGAISLSAYLIWVVYYRAAAKLEKHRQFHEALIFPCLFPVLCAFGIAATRVVDHVHSPANVAIGGVIGIIFAGIYSFRIVRLIRLSKTSCEAHESENAILENRSGDGTVA